MSLWNYECKWVNLAKGRASSGEFLAVLDLVCEGRGCGRVK